MRGIVVGVLAAALVLRHGVAAAQDAPDPPETPPAPDDSRVQIHGFASEGAFVSTANHYIGESSRGSVELFEAGINVSTEVADRLRFGFQLYGRDMGDLKDLPPRIDFA